MHESSILKKSLSNLFNLLNLDSVHSYVSLSIQDDRLN